MAFQGIHLGGKFYPADLLEAHYRDLPDSLSELDRRTLTFCGAWLSGESTFVIETSGSTGKPKAISISRRQMEMSAQMTGEALDLRPGDHALCCLSPTYIAGVMMLVRAMVLDLRLTVVTPAKNPFQSPYVRSSEGAFDFVAMVPLQLNATLDDEVGRSYLNRMKAILVGGAPISRPLQRSIQKIQSPVFHTFGMTETVSHIALRRLNGRDASEEYRAVPHVLLDVDDRGCLMVSAPVTGGRRVATNDRVELKSPGSFIWLGRADHVINSGGVKVQPERVEAVLSGVLHQLGEEDVPEFIVTGIPDDALGEMVVAVFESDRLPGDQLKAMHSVLRGKLTRFEVPRAFHFNKDLLRTGSGKVDRLLTTRRLLDSL